MHFVIVATYEIRLYINLFIWRICTNH